jgi:HEAT repeat protein
LSWKQLGRELLALDRWGDFDTSSLQASTDAAQAYKWKWAGEHPVNLMVNGAVPLDHFETYVPTLVRALGEMTGPVDLEFVARSLTRKGLTVAVPALLKLFSNEELINEPTSLWAVGNAIYTIQPRDHVDECLHICRNAGLGESRHKLIVHLSRFKKSEEVFQTLLALLDDESVRGAALEALKRFGDVRAIPAIKRTPVRKGDDGIYERHQKQMALKKLTEKKLNS